MTKDSYLRRLGAGARKLLGAVGYELVRRHYYSPIPDLDRLPPDVWSRQSTLAGVQFDTRAGLAFVRENLTPYLAEYDPPLGPTSDAHRFYLSNGFYEGLDAETLYAMVRHLQPKRIVELGSGFSTLVIADARARNDAHDVSCHHVYDPYPQRRLEPAIRHLAELHQIPAAEVPTEAFTRLQAGDLLFVDTTHTVKIASDVNRIILEVLPTLSPGVYVHFHDIYLPWEYPREFLVERRFFWAEQYLLQAFLSFNRAFEPLFGTHALKRAFPDAIVALVPSAADAPRPSAFWLKRVDDE